MKERASSQRLFGSLRRLWPSRGQERSRAAYWPTLMRCRGKEEKALSTIEELKELSKKRYVSPVDIAIVYTGLGDRNSAFFWLEKAYKEHTMRIQELPEPLFDTLRSHPRFRDLMRRLALT